MTLQEDNRLTNKAGVIEETKLILSAQRRAQGNMNIVYKYFQGNNTNERRGLLTLSQDSAKEAVS